MERLNGSLDELAARDCPRYTCTSSNKAQCILEDVTSLLIAKITDFGNSRIMLILYNVYASMIVNIEIHNP